MLRSMIWIVSPHEIERRADAAGVPLREIIALAGISHTTFYRWRAGKSQPTLGVYQRLLEALHAAEDTETA